MSRLRMSLLALVVWAAASVAQAASIAGLWLTPTDHGEIEISDCDGGVCGKLVSSDRLKSNPGQADAYNADITLRARPLKGLYLFRGMTGGPSVWSGRVYNPKDGKTYQGKVTSRGPDKLALRGCVIFPLCKTEEWTRTR